MILATLLVQVLCSLAPACCELPQEEVRSHKSAAAQEEDQVDGISYGCNPGHHQPHSCSEAFSFLLGYSSTCIAYKQALVGMCFMS